MHLSGSIQSLRDAVNRIPKRNLSASRTSLNSEQKVKGDLAEKSTTSNQDLKPLPASDEQPKSSKSSSEECVRRGLVVRISAFHAGGPGSIPGVGSPFFCLSLSLSCSAAIYPFADRLKSSSLSDQQQIRTVFRSPSKILASVPVKNNRVFFPRDNLSNRFMIQ